MINFTTFTVTLPYPTLDFVCLYIIVGMLFTMLLMCYLLITNGENLTISKVFIKGLAILSVGFPYFIYLFIKDLSK